MFQRLSISKGGRNSARSQVYPVLPSASADPEKLPLTGDDADQASTIQGPVPIAHLKIKKVDHFYSKWSKKWKYTNSGSNVIPELRPLPSEGKDDPWQQFCFVVVREIPDDKAKDRQPYFKIVVKSPYLLKACKDVIGDVQGVSWNAVPLELDPKLLIAFLPQFKTYRQDLVAKTNKTEEDSNTIATLDVLIDYFHTDYRATLASIENLTAHGEITYELLYAILVPRSVMLTSNPLTGNLQALQLTSATLHKLEEMSFYDVVLEGLDVDDSDVLKMGGFSRIQSRVVIPAFRGAMKIAALDAYPMIFHPQEAELKKKFLERGRKWASIAGGIHHLQYHGTAGIRCGPNNKMVKYNLNSRVMVDRGNFRKVNPNYAFAPKKAAVPGQTENENEDWNGRNTTGSRSSTHLLKGVPAVRQRRQMLIEQENARQQALNAIPLQGESATTPTARELTEDELLIATPIVYGFSLADKLWLEFDIETIADIEWNEEAFANLVLPQDRKTLLQSLVEAHNAEIGFDDFIKGKGRGLVVNLFGPPGVGKTLSAEATSEHVKRPLYIIGAGDLGTSAAALDLELQRVFELATAWRAIVLIDEADVFLEQRSLHDLERNAMVAVFLRHLEYYPAILFLTTNRVKTFDEAFLSRIHIALHFHSLTREALKSVWTAFLVKAGVTIGSGVGISEAELNSLATRNINGRQVKNAVKTATSLAVSRGESLRSHHLTEVLDVMEKFASDFEAMKTEASA